MVASLINPFKYRNIGKTTGLFLCKLDHENAQQGELEYVYSLRTDVLQKYTRKSLNCKNELFLQN
jgi:hypothetical protein